MAGENVTHLLESAFHGRLQFPAVLSGNGIGQSMLGHLRETDQSLDTQLPH